MCAATAKPSRMYMPDEYVRTGRSMNSLELGEGDDLVEVLVDRLALQAVEATR